MGPKIHCGIYTYIYIIHCTHYITIFCGFRPIIAPSLSPLSWMTFPFSPGHEIIFGACIGGNCWNQGLFRKLCRIWTASTFTTWFSEGKISKALSLGRGYEGVLNYEFYTTLKNVLYWQLTVQARYAQNKLHSRSSCIWRCELLQLFSMNQGGYSSRMSKCQTWKSIPKDPPYQEPCPSKLLRSCKNSWASHTINFWSTAKYPFGIRSHFALTNIISKD